MTAIIPSDSSNQGFKSQLGVRSFRKFEDVGKPHTTADQTSEYYANGKNWGEFERKLFDQVINDDLPRYVITSFKDGKKRIMDWEDLCQARMFLRTRSNHSYIETWKNEDNIYLLVDVDKLDSSRTDYKVSSFRGEIEAVIIREIERIFGLTSEVKTFENDRNGNIRCYTPIVIKGWQQRVFSTHLNEVIRGIDEDWTSMVEFDERLVSLRMLGSQKVDKVKDESGQVCNIPNRGKGIYQLEDTSCKYSQLELYSAFTIGEECDKIIDSVIAEQWEIAKGKSVKMLEDEAGKSFISNMSPEKKREIISKMKRMGSDELRRVISVCNPNVRKGEWMGLCSAFANFGATAEDIINFSEISGKFKEKEDGEFISAIVEDIDHKDRSCAGRQFLIKHITKDKKKGWEEAIKTLEECKSKSSKKKAVKMSFVDRLGGKDEIDDNEEFFFTDDDCAKVAKRIFGETIKIVKKKEGNYGYIWDEDTLLWKETEKEHIQAKIIDAVKLRLEAKIKEAISNEATKDELDILDGPFQRLQGAKGKADVFNVCVSRFLDTKFTEKLDPLSEWLSLKGGFKYNMETRQLVKRDIGDYFSKELSCSIVSDTSRARKYYEGLMGKDWRILNKIMGYCWSPLNNLKKMFIMIGDRDTGKSTFFNLTTSNMGERYKPMSDQAIFETKSKGNHTDELAFAMTGTTLSIASESKKGQKINEPVVKKIVGSDSLTMRACGGKSMCMVCKGKVILQSNKFPTTSDDESFLDKLYVMIFGNQFKRTDENKRMVAALAEDREFLNQLFTLQMEGAYEYYHDQTIEESSEMRKEFIDEFDFGKEWIENECDVNTEENVESSNALKYPVKMASEDFMYWLKKQDTGDQEVGEDTFKTAMRGFKKKNVRVNGKQTKCYIGIARKKISKEDTEENPERERKQLIRRQ